MVQMWNEILEQPVVLERCLKSNHEVLSEMVEVLKERNINSVYIAARGTSDHAATYGKYVLEILKGVPVALAAASVFTVYHRDVDLKNSLVIGISQSGKAEDVLQVLKSANRQGAVTLGITNFTDSPMAVEAKFHLHCNAGLEKSVAATKTFTAQMILMAQLAAQWSGNKEACDEIDSIPALLSKTMEAAGEIEKIAPRYRFMDECFVLARGTNYPIALEAALKIQETTYARAKGFASSDFYHGPFAMVDRNIPMFIFAPAGPTMKDLKEMIHKLKQKDIELIVISNKKELLDLGTCSFSIPFTESDIISPFLNAAIAQMFACRLSIEKGLSPDNPRDLNKVTITI